MTLLTASGLSVEFAGAPIFKDVTFTVAEGDRWGIVGRNGTGKTTLFRVLAGTHPATRGSVGRTQGLTVAMMDQHRDFGDASTVWEAAAGPLAELFALEKSLEEQATLMGEMGDRVTEAVLDRYSHDLERFDRAGGYGLGARVDAVLAGLGFDPVAARDTLLSVLSGGERGRVGLARQLVAPADLLLLDEPTNHLDLGTTRWLEKWLREQQATLLVISHDRSFLRAVCNHVLHVEAGTMTPYDCGYDDFVHLRNERRMAQQRAFDKQKKVIAAEQDFINRNIAGINSSQAKGRRRRLERVERLAPPPGEAGSITLRLEPGDRGGDQVMVAEKIRLAQGDRVLVTDFNASVRRGDVVALVGANGTGKSTLLKVLAGERQPDGGEVRIPLSVALGYYRQDLSQVPPDETLYDAIANRRTLWSRGQVQSHLGRFGFSGDSVLRKARSLSGGERARVALALLELDQANLILIDEPTNHLDVETIESLEEGLEAYEGTLILVSHDRALLEALATRVWALVDGRIEDYPGTFEEWEQAVADRKSQAAAAVKAQAAKSAERVPAGKREAEARKASQGAARAAQRAVETAEADVARGEEEVRRLEQALEAPDLYVGPNGAAKAQEMSRLLTAARQALAAANARWEAAVLEMEAAG